MRSRKRRKIGKRTFDETSSGGTNHHEINATIAAGKEKSYFQQEIQLVPRIESLFS